MNIYNYDEKTLEYTSSGIADESPLEPGIYLIPAFATDIQPPDKTENETVIFNIDQNNWVSVSDYRSIKLWSKDTAKQVVAKFGETPNDINATQIEPNVDYPAWDSASETWVTDEAAKLSAQTAEATSKVNQLLSIANDKIAPLQDAVDLGISTIEEAASLTKWKK